MIGRRFTDEEVRTCLLGDEGMYMMPEERLDELRCYVDKKYPGLRQEYRRCMYPPREKAEEPEKKPEKKERRCIYGITNDRLKEMLDTDEDPAEALRKYGLLPIYSMLQSMQWRMDEMSRALSNIAEKMTEEDE